MQFDCNQFLKKPLLYYCSQMHVCVYNRERGRKRLHRNLSSSGRTEINWLPPPALMMAHHRYMNNFTLFLQIHQTISKPVIHISTTNPSSERERRINASASTCFREREKCARERERFNWRLTHGGSSVGGGKWYGLLGPISSIRLTPVRSFRHQDRVSVRAIFSTTESERKLSSPFDVYMHDFREKRRSNLKWRSFGISMRGSEWCRRHVSVGGEWWSPLQ